MLTTGIAAIVFGIVAFGASYYFMAKWWTQNSMLNAVCLLVGCVVGVLSITAGLSACLSVIDPLLALGPPIVLALVFVVLRKNWL